MQTTSKLRIWVLGIHGVIAICMGLIFFYLRAAMITPLFEVVAVVNAILLSAAALILAAITDWFVAFDAGTKSVHRFSFYLLAGIAFVLAGAFLVYDPESAMRLLVAFAAIHALAFGISAMVFARKAKNQPLQRRAMYFFGTVSILFSGIMVGLIRVLNNQEATTVLGAYLCFVGTKMLFFAWDSHRGFTAVDKAIGSRQ